MKKMAGFVCALCVLMALCVCAHAMEMAMVSNPDQTDRLNLRTEPSEDAISLGKYYNGVAVCVYSVKNGWAKVDIQGREGYMKDAFLAYGAYEDGEYRALGAYSGAVYEKWSAVPTMTVNVQSLHLRKDTSIRSESLGTYGYGTQVQILGVGTVWHHVRVPDGTGNGKVGYMKAMYLDGDVSFHKGDAGMSSVERAIVANPNVRDRLNLRAEPSEKSASLGKFYNWTPVKVLEKRADGWCKVEIGEEGCGVARGYMKTQYLAFGENMEKVASGIEMYEVTYGTAIEKDAGGADECIQKMNKGDVLYVWGDIGDEYCFVITRNTTGYFPRWALSGNAI